MHEYTRFAHGMLAVLALACAAFATMAAAPALAESRVALVIGNDLYPNLPPERQLQKAVNDAEAVGDSLNRLGFQVIRGRNLGRQALIDKLAELTAKIGPGDTVAFFYAGHGVAIGGVNYLVPSDVPAVTEAAEARVRGASISEPDLVAEIQARSPRVAFLALDACRDNPFPRTGGRSIGQTRGLADAKPARGVFTIYSAGIGQTALDRLEPNDPNKNSVFTRVFIEQLSKPGVDLSGLAVEVRERVAELALKAKDRFGQPDPREQTPAYYDQTLGGRIYLAGLPSSRDVKPPVALPAPDEFAWSFLKDTKDADQLRAFVAQFPASTRRGDAIARLLTLEQAKPAERDAADANKSAGEAPKKPAESKKVALLPPVGQPGSPCGSASVVGVSLMSRAAAPLSAGEECSLKPKDVFKECDKCPEMVVVPSGSFAMGSPENESGRQPHEGPRHRVTFAKPFAAGRFALTFEEWDECVANGGCNNYKSDDPGWGRGRRPVIDVSWDDAKAYVAFLSKKTGKTYRLLSEAEREYVARAGTTTPFWWGASISTKQANYNGTDTYSDGSKGESRQKTMPVDSFAPNPFGLYQVHGNVFEWTEDCWNDSYEGAPSDGSAWTSGDCKYRVLRGGSWLFPPRNLRAAYRDKFAAGNRGNIYSVGFRLARTLTP